MRIIVFILFGFSSILWGFDKKNLNGVAPQVKIPLTFDFFPTVVIAADKYYLSDVATCRGGLSVCRQVGSVFIGESPSPGDRMSLRVERALALVDEEFDNLAISTNQVASIELVSEGVKVNPEGIRDDLARHLESFDWPGNRRLQPVRVRVPYNFRSWPGEVTWTFPDLSHLGDLASRSFTRRTRPTPIKVLGLSRLRGQLSKVTGLVHVQFLVEQFVPTLAEIPRDKGIISEDNLQYRWLPLQMNVVEDIESIVGKQLRRRLGVGKSIKSSDLKDAYVVQRGQSVEVIIHQGTLQVKSKAKLLQPGRLGDLVTIALNNSRKRLQAKVVSSDLVEVKP